MVVVGRLQEGQRMEEEGLNVGVQNRTHRAEDLDLTRMQL